MSAAPPTTWPEQSPETTAAAVSDAGTRVIEKLKLVFDPEIPVNIYDLGLIYKIDIEPKPEGKFDVLVDMTLTTPNCPVAGQMPAMVQHAVASAEGADEVKVNLVWEPAWDKSRMTDEARMMLNMF
jgi:FeS assembly SUF system protein